MRSISSRRINGITITMLDLAKPDDLITFVEKFSKLMNTCGNVPYIFIL